MAAVTLNDSDSADRSVTFRDYCAPDLLGGTYKVTVQQKVGNLNDSTATEAEFPLVTQVFTVRAPRFSLDSALVHAAHPAPGSAGRFAAMLPHVSLTRETLPWDQDLTDRGWTSAPAHTPWMCLLVFRQDELPGEPGAQVQTRTVASLLDQAGNGTVLVPDIDPITLCDDPDDRNSNAKALAGECRTIDVSPDVFQAVAPTLADLLRLAHVREVVKPVVRRARDNGVTDLGRFSVVMGNRFPTESGAYTVHLVSLEGHAQRLGTKPSKPVRLVSLWSWSFTSQASGGTFTDVVKALALPGQADPQGLALRLAPQAGSGGGDNEVLKRLRCGYVPVSYATGTGERMPAWYRGPFTPLPTPSVPGLAERRLDVASPDLLMVYAPGSGIYDLSYASAYTLGRLLCLSHARIRGPVEQVWRRARSTAVRVLDRMSRSVELGGISPDSATTVQELADLQPALTRFHRVMAGEFREADGGAAEAAASPAAQEAPVLSNALEDRLAVFEREDVQALLAAQLAEESGPLADLVDELQTLEGIAFGHLVPDARMLPDESVRFFNIDPCWINALLDGVLGTGVTTSLDGALAKAIAASVQARLDDGAIPPPPAAGMLLRSRLAADWPGLRIEGLDGSNRPVGLVRQEALAPGVMLCLFQTVPAKVVFSEPKQELAVGALIIDGSYKINPRLLSGGTAGTFTGQLQSAEDKQWLIARNPQKPAIKVLDATKMTTELAQLVQADAFKDSSAALGLELIAEPSNEIIFGPKSAFDPGAGAGVGSES